MSKPTISVVRIPVIIKVSVRHEPGEDPTKVATEVVTHRIESVGKPSETVLNVQVEGHSVHRVMRNESNGVVFEARDLKITNNPETDNEEKACTSCGQVEGMACPCGSYPEVCSGGGCGWSRCPECNQPLPKDSPYADD